MSEESVDKNLQRAGEYFVYCLWIQNQMVDLIILHSHQKIIKKFVANPLVVPRTMTTERMRLWRDDFKETISKFKEIFSSFLSDSDKDDLEFVYAIRNAISHSSVSLGRDYFLYRPSGKGYRIKYLKKVFSVSPRTGFMKPIVFKLDFGNDTLYNRNFDVIKRLDESVLKRIAVSLKIPHSRIR